jgi:glutamine amidotransferase
LNEVCSSSPFFPLHCLENLGLTLAVDNWVTVPTNSTVTIHKQTVMIHPIIDEFYSPNPAHMRSAGFAQAKGQTITGPDKRVLRQPVGSESESAVRSEEVVNGAITRLKDG